MAPPSLSHYIVNIVLFFIPFVYFIAGTGGIIGYYRCKRDDLPSLGNSWISLLLKDTASYFTHRIGLDRVVEIHIRQVEDRTGTPTGRGVSISDPSILADGFAALMRTKPRSQLRDRPLSDGYRIRFRYEGESSYLPATVLAYRISSHKRGNASIIIFDGRRNNILSTEFTSKSFREWLRVHVDPLFQEEGTREEH